MYHKFTLCSLLLLMTADYALADEGMWLFNNPPTALLQSQYHFEPTRQWLEHLQKASLRFNSGGSGSFISPNGLAITNHHVGADTLQKLSSTEHNYLQEGFYAKTQVDEKPAVDLELNVLDSIEDVTQRVNSDVKTSMDSAAALAARRSIIAQIEKESKDKTGLRSNVITLYKGGSYQLYRYKIYTDVRLVFAPEQQAAFFGGDPDNFEYPRFDLDICIFRVYENGKPAKIKHYLKFNTTGPREGELVFVSGNPARTNREWIIADLADARDRIMPQTLSMYYRREVALGNFSERSVENKRRAEENIFGIKNSRKFFNGALAGLLDPTIFDRLVMNENALRQEIQSRAQKNSEFKDTLTAYDKIKTAQSVMVKNAPLYDYYESEQRPIELFYQPRGFASTLFKYARYIVRAAEERNKPNGERLPDYQEGAIEPLELELFSKQTLHNDFEILLLSDSLTDLAIRFGANDPLVKKVLAGKPPSARAVELITGTKLKDLEFRKKMYKADSAAIIAANDPLLNLALLIDPTARAAAKIFNTNDEIRQQAYAQIAKSRFAIQGATTYPDATYTLRLAFGTVRGVNENGKHIPAFTDFAGLYARSAEHKNKEPFNLPERWVKKKAKLDLTTHFNFICDADIIGGNSGSPVVNKAGEFVGIIFDGNLASLILNYTYDKQASAVSVDSAAISVALRNIYDAGALADEIEGKSINH